MKLVLLLIAISFNTYVSNRIMIWLILSDISLNLILNKNTKCDSLKNQSNHYLTHFRWPVSNQVFPIWNHIVLRERERHTHTQLFTDGTTILFPCDPFLSSLEYWNLMTLQVNFQLKNSRVLSRSFTLDANYRMRPN